MGSNQSVEAPPPPTAGSAASLVTPDGGPPPPQGMAGTAVTRQMMMTLVPAVFLGSVPVDTKTGGAQCDKAIERIAALNVEPREIHVQINTTGVALLDRKTKDVLKDIPTDLLTYVYASAADPMNICMLLYAPHSRLVTCLMVRVKQPKQAVSLFVGISECFRMHSGEQEMPESPTKMQKHMTRSRSNSGIQGKAMLKGASITNTGRLLGRSQCHILGSLVVQKAASEGLVQAALKLMRKNLQNKSPQKARMEVMERRAVLYTWEMQPLLDVGIEDVVLYNSYENKKIFVFIASRPEGGLIVTALNVPPTPEGVPSLRRAMWWAKTGEKRREQLTADGTYATDAATAAVKPATEKATGTVQKAIPAVHVASMPSRGPSLPEADLTRMASKFNKNRKQTVLMQISTEGLRIFDSLSGEVVMTFVLGDIASTTTVPTPSSNGQRQTLGFVLRDNALNILAIQAFELDKQGSTDVSVTLKKTFELAQSEKQLRGDPFQAVGGRVPAPKTLFRRQIHRRHLKAMKPIGAGQFGQVYLATQTVNERKPTEKQIYRAVKTLRGQASEADRDEFVHESEVMLRLGHRNLVSLIGVAVQQRPWLMVLEFLQYGDLKHILKGLLSKDMTLTVAEATLYAVQLADGMAYMSDRRFLHMDIAARNCLVGANNLCKISDFGLARKLAAGEDQWIAPRGFKLPIKWCSYEVLERRIMSSSSDVWAFGITLFEILSHGEMPYSGISNHEVPRKLRDGVRCKLQGDKAKIYSSVMDIATKTWHMVPNARPTFHQLAADLLKLLATFDIAAIRDVGASVTQSKDVKFAVPAALHKALAEISAAIAADAEVAEEDEEVLAAEDLDEEPISSETHGKDREWAYGEDGSTMPPQEEAATPEPEEEVTEEDLAREARESNFGL
eukprot:m.481762 g.481762  ORF g.481762 m.481762 type:complete len:903 (-) comp22323_c0_seq1:103-2811(-)